MLLTSKFLSFKKGLIPGGAQESKQEVRKLSPFVNIAEKPPNVSIPLKIKAKPAWLREGKSLTLNGQNSIELKQRICLTNQGFLITGVLKVRSECKGSTCPMSCFDKHTPAQTCMHSTCTCITHACMHAKHMHIHAFTREGERSLSRLIFLTAYLFFFYISNCPIFLTISSHIFRVISSLLYLEGYFHCRIKLIRELKHDSCRTKRAFKCLWPAVVPLRMHTWWLKPIPEYFADSVFSPANLFIISS